jgi:hypothetical protein
MNGCLIMLRWVNHDRSTASTEKAWIMLWTAWLVAYNTMICRIAAVGQSKLSFDMKVFSCVPADANVDENAPY